MLTGMHKCTHCGILPIANFSKNQTNPSGYRNTCKACDAIAKRKYRAKTKAHNTDNFEITVEDPAVTQARASRLSSDHETLKPGDLRDEYSAPGYDREKKQEYNAQMGAFATAARDLTTDPAKLAEYVSLTAEQERRWINKRLGRAVTIGTARELLLTRQFEQIANRVRWPVHTAGFAARPKHSPARRAACAILSDLHFGSILPGYENPVAFDFLRASRSLAHVIQSLADYKTQYRDHTECVLGWNGDELEGMLGHNDIDNAGLSEQMVAVGQAAVSSITYLAEHFPRVRVYKRPGNHGRNKLRHEGRATSSKWDNFETIIFKFVAMQCRGLPNVTFDIQRSPVAVVPLFDRNMLMLHADTELNLKSPSSSGGKASWGNALKSVNSDQRYGAHIDLIHGGHFHDPTIMYFEHGVAVCQGALTPTNGYARSGGYESVTGQFIFESVPGHAFGDSRFIRTGTTQHTDATLDQIIPAFDFDEI